MPPKNDNTVTSPLPQPYFEDVEVSLAQAQRSLNQRLANFPLQLANHFIARQHNEAEAERRRANPDGPHTPFKLSAATFSVLAYNEGVGKSRTLWDHLFAAHKAKVIDLRCQRFFLSAHSHAIIKQHIDDARAAATKHGVPLEGFGVQITVHVGVESGCTANNKIKQFVKRAHQQGASDSETACVVCPKRSTCPVITTRERTAAGIHFMTHAHLSAKVPPPLKTKAGKIQLPPTIGIAFDERFDEGLKQAASTSMEGVPLSGLDYRACFQRMILELASLRRADIAEQKLNTKSHEWRHLYSKINLTREMVEKHFNSDAVRLHRLNLADTQFPAAVKSAAKAFRVAQREASRDVRNDIKKSGADALLEFNSLIERKRCKLEYSAMRLIAKQLAMGKIDDLGGAITTEFRRGKDGAETLFVGINWREPLHRGFAHIGVAVFDATADEDLSLLIKGNLPVNYSYERVRVKAPLERVFKIENSPMSKSKLSPALKDTDQQFSVIGNDADAQLSSFDITISIDDRLEHGLSADEAQAAEDARTPAELDAAIGMRAPKLCQQIIEARKSSRSDSHIEKFSRLIVALDQRKSNCLSIVTYKAVSRYFEWHGIAPSAAFLHHGKVAGNRQAEHVSEHLVIGRPMPSAKAQFEAGLSWFALVDEEVNHRGKIEMTTRHLRMVDGSTYPVQTQAHADQLLDRLFQQTYRCGPEQALARSRGVLRGTDRGAAYGVDTFDFTEVVPDRTYAGVIDWNDLPTSHIDALVHGFGIVPPTHKLAFAVAPKLFTSEGQARALLDSKTLKAAGTWSRFTHPKGVYLWGHPSALAPLHYNRELLTGVKGYPNGMPVWVTNDQYLNQFSRIVGICNAAKTAQDERNEYVIPYRGIPIVGDNIFVCPKNTAKTAHGEQIDSFIAKSLKLNIPTGIISACRDWYGAWGALRLRGVTASQKAVRAAYAEWHAHRLDQIIPQAVAAVGNSPAKIAKWLQSEHSISTSARTIKRRLDQLTSPAVSPVGRT